MLNKNDILNFIGQNYSYLQRHFHIQKIGIFGSFAKNEQTELSDIDLIIELEDNTPDIYELKMELREFFGGQFNRKIDIASEKYLKSYVKADIMKETIYFEQK
jgi:hypothetical protein